MRRELILETTKRNAEMQTYQKYLVYWCSSREWA
jgi:hypothetical protein